MAPNDTHPEISEQDARMRLAALWLDRKTMIAAFAWDPQTAAAVR